MLDSLRESVVGRYLAPAVVAGKLLTTSTEARADDFPYVEVEADQFMARCSTTEDGVLTREAAAALTARFERRLNAALKPPSDREFERFVRNAMYERITDETGNPQYELVTPGEVDARVQAVLATDQLDARDEAAVEPARKVLRDARQETAEDAAILDLVMDADGNLFTGEQIAADHPELEKLYRFGKAMEFVKWFKETYHRDCEKAVRYTLKYKKFPAVDLISDITSEPEPEFNVTYKREPELRPAAWRTNSGYLRQEFEETLSLVEEQKKRAKRLDRLDPCLYMGPEVHPVFHLTPEELVVDPSATR